MSEKYAKLSTSSMAHHAIVIKPMFMFTLAGMLFISVLLAACASNDGGDANTLPTTSLAQLHWCAGKPMMVFRDEGANTTGGISTNAATLAASATATTVANWNVVKANLGFTVYLPAGLPNSTCLISAASTLHDPILGSSFTIGYLLPTNDSISLSEAPERAQNPAFQCNTITNTVASSTATGSTSSTKSTAQAPVQICTGTHHTTNIVFSARGTTSSLQAFFQDLQPDVTWIPTS